MSNNLELRLVACGEFAEPNRPVVAAEERLHAEPSAIAVAEVEQKWMKD